MQREIDEVSWNRRDILEYIDVFSITVQRNHMRFGGIVAPNSGCLSLTLGLCTSFSFGMVSVLLSRFDAPFKCTVNKML